MDLTDALPLLDVAVVHRAGEEAPDVREERATELLLRRPLGEDLVRLGLALHLRVERLDHVVGDVAEGAALAGEHAEILGRETHERNAPAGAGIGHGDHAFVGKADGGASEKGEHRDPRAGHGDLTEILDEV
ncbi:MAG: hypothetical protein AAGH15_05870 [Myxococcota bacterium]